MILTEVEMCVIDNGRLTTKKAVLSTFTLDPIETAIPKAHSAHLPLPFSNAPIWTREPLRRPRRRRLRHLPDLHLIDLYTQPNPMEGINIPIFDRPNILIADIVGDVVLPNLCVVMDPHAHLLDCKVTRAYRELHARCQRDGSEGAVRRHCHVVRFRHGSDAAQFRYPAAVRDVRLQDVDGAVVQEALRIPAAVEALAQGDGDSGELAELLDPFMVLAEQGFLDEERVVGLQSLGELFGHGFVQPAVKIEGGVHAERFHNLEPVHTGLEGFWCVKPVDVFGSVHLDCAEALGPTFFCRGFDIAGSVAADPGVHFDLVADGAAQELVQRHIEPAGLEIPEGDVDTCEGGHQDGTAAVETETVAGLPNVLDSTRLKHNVKRVQTCAVSASRTYSAS